MGKAVDRVSDSESDGSYYFFVTTAGVFVVGSIASWVRVYCLGTAAERISSKLRKDLFDSYMDKDMEFFDASKTGELITILDKDVAKASEAVTEKFAAGLRSINSSINGSIILFMASPQLCGVSLGLVPLVGVGAMTMSKYSRKLAEKLRQIESTILSFALERFGHITTVRLNGRESVEKLKFADYTNSSYDLAKNAFFAQGAFMSFINMATNLSLAAVLCVGGGLIAKNKMTPGGLTRFAMQSAFVGLGFSGLSTFYSDMTKSLDAAKRVFDTLDENNKNQMQCNSDVINQSSTPKSSKGSIEFSSVSFSFISREISILSKISLTVQPNCITAVVGKSGSGKSTLMAILCGLYRPTSGTVSLDGININNVDQKWLRSQIGVVEQQAGLLSGTIRENIAYGKEIASESDIVAAAQKAYAHDFIMSFPDGYDTQVGENGTLLSGGQAARIAIARAIVKEPKYLLLDEATASLDQDSENQVVEVLSNLCKSKTTILVFTHSETLMKAASVCHVLLNGSITSSGSFNEISEHITVK